MALAPVGRRVGGASRIAEFWRNSAEFDPIAGGPGPRSPVLASRAAGRPAGIAASDCRAGHHGQRSPVRGPRAGMFGPWSPGQGRAGFTDLIGQRGPVTGQKKTPAGNLPAGALSALWGLLAVVISQQGI